MLVVPWLIIGVAGLIFFSQLGVALSLQTVGLMHLVVTFPLVVAIVSAGLVRFQRSLEEAAIDLGASSGRCCATWSSRRSAPSIAAASIFAFAWSFNNFEISFFTGGFEQTFPVWVFSILRQSENLPIVNAVSTVIAARPDHRRLRRLGADEAAHPERRRRATDADRPADRGDALMEVGIDPGPAGQRPRATAPAAAARLPRHADGRCCWLFFLAPMLVMLGVALDHGLLDGGVGFNLTLTNFTDVHQRPALPQGRADHVRDRDRPR